MAQYDIADVNNQLQQEAGRIGEMIAAKLIATDPWNRLIKQDTFPAGMGESIQTLIQERTTVPNASSTAWEDVGTNDGTGNNCNPTPQVVDFARTLRSYNLQQAAIRSPGFCVNDLRTAWKAEEQAKSKFSKRTANGSGATATATSSLASAVTKLSSMCLIRLQCPPAELALPSLLWLLLMRSIKVSSISSTSTSPVMPLKVITQWLTVSLNTLSSARLKRATT
jgi:hypothetical protein